MRFLEVPNSKIQGNYPSPTQLPLVARYCKRINLQIKRFHMEIRKLHSTTRHARRQLISNARKNNMHIFVLIHKNMKIFVLIHKNMQIFTFARSFRSPDFTLNMLAAIVVNGYNFFAMSENSVQATAICENGVWNIPPLTVNSLECLLQQQPPPPGTPTTCCSALQAKQFSTETEFSYGTTQITFDNSTCPKTANFKCS